MINESGNREKGSYTATLSQEGVKEKYKGDTKRERERVREAVLKLLLSFKHQ